MQDNESYTFEDRVYLTPETSRDERLSFIDTLRQTQQNNTAQVNANTYALGSQLPSNLGGLGGSEGTFTARYQTPQTDATIAQLREVAQAKALNTAMTNLTEAWKKRYQDALNNYRRRSLTPANTNPKNGGKDDPLVDLMGRLQYPVESSTVGGQLGSTVMLPQGGVGVFGQNPDGTPNSELLAVKQSPSKKTISRDEAATNVYNSIARTLSSPIGGFITAINGFQSLDKIGK